MTAEWVPGGDVAFGVIGEDPDPIVTRLRDVGADVDAVREAASADDPAALESPDVVIAAGERGLLAAVHGGADGPILPVDVGGGIADVSAEELADVASAIEAGDARAVSRPLLATRIGDRRWVALMDAMAVTTEPAKISEFEIETRVRGRERTVDTVRADGIVVATSAGTPGYATAAGGPVLSPDARSTAVVPVGPFRVEHTEWVLDPPLSITVARDEAAVSLLVDDEAVGSVRPNESITFSWGPSVRLLTHETTRNGFDRV